MMDGMSLYEARLWELQAVNAIRFANLVMPSTPVHSSVEDVTVTSQPKSEQKKPDAHLINGNP